MLRNSIQPSFQLRHIRGNSALGSPSSVHSVQCQLLAPSFGQRQQRFSSGCGTQLCTAVAGYQWQVIISSRTSCMSGTAARLQQHCDSPWTLSNTLSITYAGQTACRWASRPSTVPCEVYVLFASLEEKVASLRAGGAARGAPAGCPAATVHLPPVPLPLLPCAAPEVESLRWGNSWGVSATVYAHGERNAALYGVASLPHVRLSMAALCQERWRGGWTLATQLWCSRKP